MFESIAETRSLSYGSTMLFRVIITLLMGVTPFSAFACSLPDRVPAISEKEIKKITLERIARADVVLDGAVFQLKDGRAFLKPIKVWKGKWVARYYIENTHCGVVLEHGTKVRALLEKEPFGFMMMVPIKDNELRTKLYDKTIDIHLGQNRPANFRNGDFPYPPPIRKRRLRKP